MQAAQWRLAHVSVDGETRSARRDEAAVQMMPLSLALHMMEDSRGVAMDSDVETKLQSHSSKLESNSEIQY